MHVGDKSYPRIWIFYLKLGLKIAINVFSETKVDALLSRFKNQVLLYCENLDVVHCIMQ